jgi:uncharacterized protein involved in type VI secretion and phage assembly
VSAFEETAVAHVLEERVPHGLGGRWYGVYPALVSDVRDPDGLGRVKVTLPWSPDASGDRYEAWARVATLMAGGNRGTWFIPDIDDEVLVAFEHGDPRWPHVVGGLWNGRDAPPESMDGGGKNALKVIRSRNGVKITLDDTDGRERLVIETPGGQKVTLADGPSSIELADANGNVVRMEASGITLSTGTKLTIQAGTVEISSATVTVNAGMSQFNGAAQANTVITPSVVGASYTPGAGNIW